jgi:diguanylate cyclase
MPLRRNSEKKADGDPRRRIFLWALLLSFIAGAFSLGMPIDLVLKIARNKIRAHDASGQIIIVGIDDRTIRAANKWPWPRSNFGTINDRLSSAGAQRLYYDFDFSLPSSATEDAALAAAIMRSGSAVVLATRFSNNRRTGEQIDNVPAAPFRRNAALANINVWYDGLGYAWTLPYAMKVAGRSYPTMSAHIAGRQGRVGDEYPIDYAVRIESIPYLSAADIISGQFDPARVKGRTVIVAPVSDRFDDIQLAPGYGFLPGGYLHVLGAETLMAGTPRSLHWAIPVVLAMLAAAGGLYLRRRALIALCLVAGFAMLLAGPLLLEEWHIHAEIAPALILLTIVAIQLGLRAVRKRAATYDPVSGLPNLNGLKARHVRSSAPLVAAKIKNFGEITSTLPGELERAVVEQVAARLRFGAVNGQVYQGDDGIFAWFLEENESGPMGDHIEALHAMFRAPIKIAERSVDAAIAFGVDVALDRSVTNRLGSALVAAEEAASEGLRWKGYDRERLKDAEWKLSLLGRLDLAIDSGEVWVAFQPQLDLATGRITGAEALARWTHPEKGDISPQDFILVAEQNNRIERLTDFVIDQSIAAARSMLDRAPDFTIAVNLSARLLDDTGTVGRIRAALEHHGVPASNLTIEITESASIAGNPLALQTLHDLRTLGAGLSIDDYGTGFSTLDYIKKVPATEIKIDRSFVALIVSSLSDRLMVNSTIELAHSLDRRIVAEGVEDQETLMLLKAMGCDLAQGYFIGRPANFDSLSELMGRTQSAFAA